MWENESQVAATARRLLGGGELGDRLGAFGDGVLGKLTGEDEADGSLDLTRRDRRLLRVGCELYDISVRTIRIYSNVPTH